MKARDLKNISVPIELGNRTFRMAFDFNALAELEEVYGDIDKALRAIKTGKGRLKAIRALIYAGIKPRYPKIRLIEVGELLTEIISNADKADKLMEQIMNAIEIAYPEPSKEDIESGE